MTLDWHWALRLPPDPDPGRGPDPATGRGSLWLCRLDRYRCFLLADAPLELWEWAGMAGDEQEPGGEEGEGEEGEGERAGPGGEGETAGQDVQWEGPQDEGGGLVVHDECAGQGEEDEEQEEGNEEWEEATEEEVTEEVENESEVDQAEEREQELERQVLQQPPRVLRRLLSVLPRPAPQQPTAGQGPGSSAAGDPPVAGLLVLGLAAAPAPTPTAGELGQVSGAQPGAAGQGGRGAGVGRGPGWAGVEARWEVFNEAWFDRHPKKKERMIGQRQRWREEQLWEAGRRERVERRRRGELGKRRRELEGQQEAWEWELGREGEGQGMEAWEAAEDDGACTGAGAEEWMQLFSGPLGSDTQLEQEPDRPQVVLPSGRLFDSWDELEEEGEGEDNW